MNTNRIINTEPLEDIDNDDDLLFTNTFVSSIQKQDISNIQKQNFRRYYEDKQKKLQNKKIVEVVDDEEIYEEHSKFSSKSVQQTEFDIVQKNLQNTIKTEVVSTVSIDSNNRNRYIYPYANNYKIDLERTFYNVKTIRLVSSTVPNTDRVIKDAPAEIRNNKISWQNLEDVFLGIYIDCAASTIIANTVDLVVPSHGLSTQEYTGDLTIRLSDSTTVPTIDGEWIVTVVDDNTLRIPLDGGITAGQVKVDTGFPTYSVYITPGNYNMQTILDEILKKMNLVKRRKGEGLFHFFTIDASSDTDVITFRSYITTELEIDPISTELGTGNITVSAEQHGFKDGDYVLIYGMTSVGGILSSILNGLFIVKEATRSDFKYEVNQKATFSSDGGGNAGKIGKPTEFRFLFDTAESKIVKNLGFPEEDSGEYLNTTTTQPLSIYTKSITNAQVISSTFIEFTSPVHGLETNLLFTISSISVGYEPTCYTSTSHGLEGKKRVFISFTASTPQLNGFYNVTVNGLDSFIINNITIISSGVGTGTMKHGGDSIKILNLKSLPIITAQEYAVESVTANTFRINTYKSVSHIDTNSIQDTIIQTNKLYIEHPSHGFNEIVSIEALPFLQSTWTPYIGATGAGTDSQRIDVINGVFYSFGNFGDVPGLPLFDTYDTQKSTNGTVWTSHNVGIYPTSIAYSPTLNRHVIVGGAGYTNSVITSDNGGVTWTPRSINGDWGDIVWSPELSIFVACGYSRLLAPPEGHLVMTSTNGISWSFKPYYEGDYGRAIVWSSELGLFVVICGQCVYVSSDGNIWTRIAIPYANWLDIVWSPGTGLFVACSYIAVSGSNIITSSDGYTWVLRPTPMTYCKSIAWSEEIRTFVVIAYDPYNPSPFMTSRDGINWVKRDLTPFIFLNSVCWAPHLMKFVASGYRNTNGHTYVHSNLVTTDVSVETLAAHTYTGTRYLDKDFAVSTVIPNNADIAITSHGLQTNDEILVTDSTTTPSINGSYFVTRVSNNTLRIPVTLTTGGTCKVRHGDSIIFTGTNSVPSLDGIEATVIGYGSNYLELSMGITIASPGTIGIIGRKNQVSLHRVQSSEPFGEHFAGIPLELINDRYHSLKVIDENNYMIKLEDFATVSYTGGGNEITVSSEKHGQKIFQSNTDDFEETGKLFRAITLSGEPYIFITSPGLTSVFTPDNKKIGDIFAKIILDEQPGNIVFNSFITSPKIFNPPINSIKDIELSVKRRDGVLFDFINLDYSISFEITEIVDQIQQSAISGRTGASDLYTKI
jgi:hypothetical protein